MKKLLFLFALFIPLVCAQADDEPQYEDFPAGAGSQLYPMGCKRVDSNTAQTSTDGDLSLPVCDQYGQLKTSSSFSFTGGTSDATKLEDAAHSSGDRGDFVLGIVNSSNTALAADGDYVGFSTDTAGRLKIAAGSLTIGDVTLGTYARNEDSAHTSTHSFVTVANAVRQDTLSSSVDTDGDYGFQKFDALGRMYINPHGASTSQFVQGCSANDVDTTTAEELMAAAGASLYYNITSLNCTNDDASVATRVEIQQDYAGTPVVLWSFMLPANSSDGQTFAIPLRTTLTNKTIGVDAIVTSAQVRCCLTGYTSTN